jgi:hypothetical protein
MNVCPCNFGANDGQRWPSEIYVPQSVNESRDMNLAPRSIESK